MALAAPPRIAPGHVYLEDLRARMMAVPQCGAVTPSDIDRVRNLIRWLDENPNHWDAVKADAEVFERKVMQALTAPTLKGQHPPF